MPTSPSIQHCIPLSYNPENNSLYFKKEIKMGCGKNTENDGKKSLKHHFHRSSSFRKHVQRSEFIHGSKNIRRRSTFSGPQDSKATFKKRRRTTSIVWPTKFLLGGNRTDPLNLKSLEDEAVNQELNAFSPASSPMPIPPRRSQVQLVIPRNIYDPLNLNSGEEIELNESRSRKRRRHRKQRREDSENQGEAKDIFSSEEPGTEPESNDHKFTNSINHVSENIPVLNNSHTQECDELADKKISVSVEDDLKNLVGSTIKESEEKSSHQKQILKRRRSKSRIQKADTVKFRANAEKFCYGNHITSFTNWNFDGSSGDPRIAYFNMDFFKNKDVLDIGCNTGNITLFIAKHFYPRRITGIDIDKKLVKIALRQMRETNESISCSDMPKSMTSLFGPLAKVLLIKNEDSRAYPNNVAFLEANYIPAFEDYLETQKPAYDTILCLRVTKWIHLNFGDEGLKMAFKRMYAQLRFGGRLILEPQPWFTYSANKRITPSIYKTYCSLKMRPDMFCTYLLSSEVGFSSVEIIGRATNYAKGYRHNIYLLTKDYHHNNDNLLDNRMSPIPFHNDQWNPDSEDSFDDTSDYSSACQYSMKNVKS